MLYRFEKMANILTRRQLPDGIAVALIGFAIWECLTGWAQLAGFIPSRHSLYPATGTFYNPGPYCAFLGTIAPLALYYCLTAGAPRPLRWLSAAYLVGALSLMPALMGRTGWIGAIAGCGLVAVWCGKIRRPGRKGMLITLTCAVIFVVLLFCLKPESAIGRLFLWQIGYEACFTHPLTGVGWDHVSGALGEAQESYFICFPDSSFTSVAGTPQYAFNEFLQIGIAFGIPAMLLAIAIITGALQATMRAECYGVAGSLVAFTVTCLFSYPLQFREFIVVLSLLLICAAMCLSARIYVRAIICVATGICGWCTTCHISEREAHAEEWLRMRHAYSHRTLTNRDIRRLDSLATVYGAAPEFLFDYGMALRRSGRHEASNAILRRGVKVSADPMFLNIIGRNYQDMHMYWNADEYYWRSMHRLPGRLYPAYLLARMYAAPQSYCPEVFYDACSHALAMKPKVMSPAVHQMREELKHLHDSIIKTDRRRHSSGTGILVPEHDHRWASKGLR